MSATSADKGHDLDVDRTDRESQPGLGSTEGHRISPVPENFASGSVPADVADNTDRPTTAIKLPTDAKQAESSSSNSKPSTQPFVEHPPPSSLETSGKQTSKENRKPSATSSSIPSGPVLVNPGLPTPSSSSHRSNSAMQLALSPTTLPHSIRGPKNRTKFGRAPQTLPQAPSPSSFSFASILTSLTSDPATQSDIDAIAEICSRSRLSMANEYTAHREPIGPGAVDEVRIAEGDVEGTEFDDGIGNGNDANPEGAQQRLVLDTTGAAALYRSPNPLGAGTGGGVLETVDEAPTPLSSGSRGHQLGGDHTYGSNSANPSQSPTASAVSEDVGMTSRWGFLDVWERGGARLGRGGAASRSVLGLSGTTAVGTGESFGLEGAPELRENVSGSAGESRAVRQLMRVAGA